MERRGENPTLLVFARPYDPLMTLNRCRGCGSHDRI
jgi:hypothetical protein